MIVRLFLAVGFLSVFSFPAQSAVLGDYAGQYVLKLGTRNFLVLNLTVDRGAVTGSIVHPERSDFGSGGTTFSDISAEVTKEVVTSASVQQGHLQIISQNAKDATDKTTFELTLVPPDGATLKIIGVPLEPWKLTRVPAQPTLSVATDWDPKHSYLPDETEESNVEMQRIFDEDQKARETRQTIDWAVVGKQDDERRKQVAELLARGALHTGKDFERAAFVFQHGSTPDDYLLAHSLAMIAIARGNPGATWIATATLDRYLQSIKQPQVFGTQFSSTNGNWTQEPYNRSLISDALRRMVSVPSQAEQEKQLADYKAGKQ